MRLVKIISIALISFILIVTAVFFLAKDIIIKRLEKTVVTKIERAINKDIAIGGISYIPSKGVALKNIKIYKKDSSVEEASLKALYINVNLGQLIWSKRVMAVFNVDNLKKGALEADGIFIVKSGGIKNIFAPFESLSLKSISIYRADILSPVIELEKISGDISIDADKVYSSAITFYHNQKPHNLSFSVKNPKTMPLADINVTDGTIDAHVNFMKINQDTFEIKKAYLRLFNSYFDFTGTAEDMKNPVLLLNGSLSFDTQDLVKINPRFKKTYDYLRLEGVLEGEAYMSIPVKGGPAAWDMGLRGRSRKTRIWDYKFYDVSFVAAFKNGVISTPLLTASPYNGSLAANYKIGILEKGLPYVMNLKLDNIDINGLAQDSELKNKNILGKLYSELHLEGSAADNRTMAGKGTINIQDANLGPMPLLSPLVGQAYGALRSVIPNMKSIEISGGTCYFAVQDRKIMTNNLLLWGDALNIRAKGYIDFDKNLNFQVENELKEISAGEEDWQKGIVTLLTTMGKVLGSAYLTGTLKNPKWEFQYFSAVNTSTGESIKNIIKDIFE